MGNDHDGGWISDLSWSSVDWYPQLTLDWHSILDQYLINRHSIDTLVDSQLIFVRCIRSQSTFSRVLTNCWSSVMIDTPLAPWSTLHGQLIWQSTNFQLMYMSRLTLGQLSTDCWSSVNRVLTQYRLRCCSSTDQDVNQGYQSTLDDAF